MNWIMTTLRSHHINKPETTASYFKSCMIFFSDAIFFMNDMYLWFIHLFILRRERIYISVCLLSYQFIIFYCVYNTYMMNDFRQHKYQVSLDLNIYCMIIFKYIWSHRFEWLSEWLLFNANSAIFQQYHGENKLIINEMMIRSALY
jgi:hypothetical protein